MDALQLVGEPRHHALLRSAAHTSGLRPAVRTPAEALRGAGELTLVIWPPGAHPLLEQGLFAEATPVLHAWWDARRAEVGPLVSAGAGPCPGCHRRAGLRGAAGHHRALASWALGWACLQAVTYLAHGTSELIGASWSWDLAEPGLRETLWPRRPDCPTAGCARPGHYD